MFPKYHMPLINTLENLRLPQEWSKVVKMRYPNFQESGLISYLLHLHPAVLCILHKAFVAVESFWQAISLSRTLQADSSYHSPVTKTVLDYNVMVFEEYN